jgi:ubiquitin-conjugating enzyme E2 O
VSFVVGTTLGATRADGRPAWLAPSDMYDDNTFVLSRDFVRRACEWPSRTFTIEINHFYLEREMLKTVIEQSRGMVAESERRRGQGSGAGGQARPASEVVAGLKVLSPSACALLRTTLGELERVMRAKGKEW